MSAERVFEVAIPLAYEEKVRDLAKSAHAALERHRRAPIGDRTEANRYEHIQAAIDDIAFAELDGVLRGEPSRDASDLTVRLVWPFVPGATVVPAVAREPRPVAAVFRSELENPTRRAAVEERFAAQLRRVVSEASDDGEAEAINPSDIPNRVLSERLREYYARSAGSAAIDAPVVYRDGSSARPLRLRSVTITDEVPRDGRPVLAVTLLSIRHMEMDVKVEGAWLRNREVSLRRPTGQTDELVYLQSQQQFAELASREPIELHLYQTGLAPANVGFYRALVDHHLERRGHNIVVIPWYFEGEDKFSRGSPWVLSR
jgi:hypothetical protein